MLVLSGGLFLLIAGSVAAAADETAPLVDVPEDVPGADEVVFLGDTYDFDASGSTDNTGIVAYQFDFDDAGTPVTLYSTTGKAQYTFTAYCQTWVTVHAWDAAGNEGKGYFSIDIAEKITSNYRLTDGTFNLDHSLYLVNANLLIDNAQVNINEGKGPLVAGSPGLPDMLGESLTPEGDLAGHWEPSYYTSYWKVGNPYRGIPSLDTNTKFSGEASIKVDGGSYLGGFEYHFNELTDLTMYDTISFFYHTNRNYDNTNWMYYVYFYGDWSYSSTYGYTNFYGAYQQGGYTTYHGWYPYAISLDRVNTGRVYSYNMADLSSVAVIRIYTYNVPAAYSQWIDHVGFSNMPYQDDITESTYPGGDMAGYWSGFSGISSNHLVGKYSLYRALSANSYYSRPMLNFYDAAVVVYLAFEITDKTFALLDLGIVINSYLFITVHLLY